MSLLLYPQESFEDVEQWIEDVGTYADPKVKIILVGNKCDLKEKQVVDASNAQVCGVWQ